MQALIHVEYDETEHVLSVYFKQKKLINMKKKYIYMNYYSLLATIFSAGDDRQCWFTVGLRRFLACICILMSNAFSSAQS